MLKKVIKYVDFNDKEQEATYYFNLTKAEVAEMELSTPGGLTKKIENMVLETDSNEMIRLFKTLILDSYGVKSPDGSSFIKNAALREEFSHSAAYSELFMELATNADAATEFINGILPSDLTRKN